MIKSDENIPVPIYKNNEYIYTAVYFEDLARWYIRCDASDGGQTWSVTGYDTAREAVSGFDGRVTYVEKPPTGESA